MSEKMKKLSNFFDIPVQDPEDARHRKLLNIMLLTVATGALFVLVVALVTVPLGLAGGQEEVIRLYFSIVLALLGVAATYILNRYLSGDLAGMFFLLLLIFVAVFSDEPQQVVNGRGLLIFAIPILAASALLRPWASFVMAGLSSLVIVVVGLYVPLYMPNVPAIVGFFMLALVSWLITHSLEHSLEDLQALNRALDQRVEERTRELRDAQEQLVRQEKLAVLGQLAGGVGHELRNPLGAIKNAAYFLNMILEDPEPKVKESLEILEKEVGTSEKIISSLLDFARVKIPIRRKVGVNDLIQEALSRTAVLENVEVVTQLDETSPTILADPDQLGQVFGNIILNAVQAMTSASSVETPEDSRLVVKSEIGPGWVAVSFTDIGVGIPEENLERLFEPLFTTKAKGIGLGLAVTRTLLEGHGGTIEVDSEVGKGSTFTVRLPIDGEEDRPADTLNNS